jgi:hypothetical protein
MEPITLVLVGSALFTAFAAWKGLKRVPSTNSAIRGGTFPPPSTPQQAAADAQIVEGSMILANAQPALQKIALASQEEAQASSAQAMKTAMTSAMAGATTGVTMALTTAASAGSAAALGAATFGIGAAVGIAVLLWSKHEARIKGAKTENAAATHLAAAYKETIQGIFAAYNSGQLTKDQAVAELVQTRSLIMQSMTAINHMPGVNWSGNKGMIGSSTQKYFQVTCDKHCTVGCCIYNGVIGPTLNNAIAMFRGQPASVNKQGTGGGNASMKVVKSYATIPIGTNKYGFAGLASFTLALKR